MSPGRLDPTTARRRLAALDVATTQLERHRGLPREALARDLDLQWAVLHGLQLCAQASVDLATQISAAAGRDVPDYASAVDALADLGVLPTDFARTFRGIAGFRNVVVHEYLDVDLGIVARVLATGLDDFRTFARHAREWVERTGP